MILWGLDHEIADLDVFGVDRGALYRSALDWRTGGRPIRVRKFRRRKGGYDWSGGYAGLSIGYSRHNARYEDRDYDWYGSTHEYNSSGFMYGGQVGWNWQSGPTLFGVEADFYGLTNDRNTLFASDDRVNNQVNWMASLRARTGIALDRTLIYLTGGIAVADFDRSWIEFNDPDDSWPDLGDTKVGAIAGFGVERAFFGNWTARVQALMATFGDNTTVNDNDYPLIIDDTIFMVQTGVNYRFGETQSAEGGFVEGDPFDFSGVYAGITVGGHSGDGVRIRHQL